MHLLIGHKNIHRAGEKECQFAMYFHIWWSTAPVKVMSKQPVITPIHVSKPVFLLAEIDFTINRRDTFPNSSCHLRGEEREKNNPLSCTTPFLLLESFLQNAIHFTEMCISCTAVELLFRVKMSFFILWLCFFFLPYVFDLSSLFCIRT